MKNKYALTLKDVKKKGVEEGLFLMAHICLIALENTMNKWDIPVDNQFYKDMESEMDDIYKEVMEAAPNGEIKEMAERLSFYVDEIRERRGMDDSQRIESDRTD